MPQLDPMLPLDTPTGEGFAFWRTDYSQEHDTLYSVIITSTREVWDFPQPLVRGVKNISMGRTKEPTPFRVHAARDEWLCWANPKGERVLLREEQDPNAFDTLIEGGPWRLV